LRFLAILLREAAAQPLVALGNCANAAKDVSPAERDHFTAVQNDCSDEEIISFWLSVSSLKERQVPMFVAKQWAKRTTNISEWIALLERNTAQSGNN
jgi:hypothetical protein